MVIEPQTELRLLSFVNLTDYSNQYTFNDIQEQTDFFKSKSYYLPFNNFRYIRRDNVIRVNRNVEDLYQCDYVMYQNANFGTKWFYAFITRKEYVNDSTTAIYIETDVFQTWYFEIEMKKCLIARSHQRQYDYYEKPQLNNFYPESLEYGRDYVVTHTENISWGTEYYALICSSSDLTKAYGTTTNPEFYSAPGGEFDRMPSALSYYIVDNIAGNSDPRTDSIKDVLETLSNFPWVTQCIQSITIIPADVVGKSGFGLNTIGNTNVKIGVLPDGFTTTNLDVATIDNWWEYFGEYKNTKLYTYPYSYIEMTAYNGTQFIIKPEALFDVDSFTIYAYNFLGASPKIHYFIDQYNDHGDNGITDSDVGNISGEFLDCGVSLGNFPQFPVMVDNYLLYMANNANSFALANNIANYNKKEAQVMAGIEGGIGVVSNLLSGNVGGAFGSAYGAMKSAYYGTKNAEIQIRQQLAKQQDAEITPPTLAGQTGGEAFNYANNITGITLKWKTIRPEYSTILEEYFTRYGYAQNDIAVPSYFGNSEFNYIQTVGCIIGGNIPQEDIEILEAMFDNGVTLWHNHNIGTYTTNDWTGD